MEKQRKKPRGILAEITKKFSKKIEGAIIRGVLEQVHWNRVQTTKILGISYKCLLYKIEQCGLNQDSHDQQPILDPAIMGELAREASCAIEKILKASKHRRRL